VCAHTLGTMEATAAAQDIYDEETQGEQSVRDLAESLRRHGQEAVTEYSEIAADVRADVSHILNGAAADLDASLGAYNPTIKRLGNGIAGQARLQSSVMEIDPHAIAGDGSQLIAVERAADIARHEAEHQRQAAVADASGIVVHGEQFDAREIREAAAISVQWQRDFLSAEYRNIAAALPMDAGARDLVRQGRFRELEQKKNS